MLVGGIGYLLRGKERGGWLAGMGREDDKRQRRERRFFSRTEWVQMKGREGKRGCMFVQSSCEAGGV